MISGLGIAVKACVYLLLLMPLLTTTTTLFPFIAPKALYARTLIELAFALWVVLAVADARYRPPRSWILVALGVYAFIALLATLTSIGITRSLWSNFERMGGLVDLLHWAALVLVMASVFRARAQWWWLLNANLAVSLSLAVVGLAQNAGWKLLPYITVVERGRVDSTLGNATFVGAYMLVSFFLALALLGDSFDRPAAAAAPMSRKQRGRPAERRQGPSPWWRAFWVAAAVLDLWVLVLSGTRGALVGVVVGVAVGAVFYVAWGKRRGLRLMAASALGAVVVVAALWFGLKDTPVGDALARSSVMVERLRTVSLTQGTLAIRLETAGSGLRAFLDRPILGWGPENFGPAFEKYATVRYFTLSSDYQDQAHNKLVEELTTKGALGFLSYIVLWGLLLGVVTLKMRSVSFEGTAASPEGNSREGLFYVGIGAALVGYFVQNMFLFDTPAPLLQFVLLMGLAASVEGHMLPEAARPWWPRAAGPMARAFDSLRGAWQKTLGRLRWPGIRPQVGMGVGLSLLLVLVGLLVYYVNYRPYREGALIASVLKEPSLAKLPWQRRFQMAEEGFTLFPSLANQPLEFFLYSVSGNWNTLTPDDIPKLLALIDPQVERALAREPREPRIRIAAARFYQVASFSDRAYLERARGYLKEASELSPLRPLLARLWQIQQSLESQTSTGR